MRPASEIKPGMMFRLVFLRDKAYEKLLNDNYGELWVVMEVYQPQVNAAKIKSIATGKEFEVGTVFLHDAARWADEEAA